MAEEFCRPLIASDDGAVLAPGRTLLWHVPGRGYDSQHETAARRCFARRLAVLRGYAFGGDFDAAQPASPLRYLVPNDTIATTALAHEVGVFGVHDLFGGVVPQPFVATKSITHALVADDAARPAGWSRLDHTGGAQPVLDGYTAFSRADARRAGQRLLAYGPVRVKRVRATGGQGQSVATDVPTLDACLDAIDDACLQADGVVLEENLQSPETVSVGQVMVGSLTVSYHGRQHVTLDNAGHSVYGGSRLTLVRGGLDALLSLPMTDALRLAVGQAQRYHGAVQRSYPDFFASRINYDVAQGRNARGQWRSGVLEQSWRIGGATSAEITALERFHLEPARQRICVASGESYGERPLPPRAEIYYRGTDSAVGPITRYVITQDDEYST